MAETMKKALAAKSEDVSENGKRARKPWQQVIKGVCHMMDYVNAFWVGGLICALVQILMQKTKMMPGRIMVLLVCTGAVLGAIGIYEPFSKWAGAGANVPLLGFGNVLWKGMKQAIDEEGALGLFKGGFTACAVGVSAAQVLYNIPKLFLIVSKILYIFLIIFI